VVESYLHGLKFNDVESLRKAFWPDAKLFFVDKKGGLGAAHPVPVVRDVRRVGGEGRKG
jgi:hypothetical protein